MQLSLDREADSPIYRQIVDQIRAHIGAGTLPPGSRLPPVRKLAAEYGLTRLTAHSAYEELQAQGLVEAHVGRGTFVAAGAPRVPVPEPPPVPPIPWRNQGLLAELARAGEPRDALSFAQAFPAPETYPARELGRALRLALDEPGVLGYGSTQGEPELRRQLAGLLADRGLSVSPESVLVTAGAQQAIDVVLRGSSEPGDVILVEEPVYPGVLELAALRGQRVVGVPNQRGELSVDALEAACSAHDPRLLYLVPTFSNPTGRSLSVASRSAVLRLASARGLLVIEDDTYGFLGLDGPPPSPLKRDDADERVVYITSLAKTLAPALRLGAVIAPASLMPSLAAAKQSSDLVCSALLQRALADYLRSGRLAAHLDAVRPLYRERRDAMMSALERHLPQCGWARPEGGLSVWVDLPEGIVERDLTVDALRRGVGIAPGSAFFPRPRRCGSIRLSFGAHPPERIEQGVASLGRVLERHLPGSLEGMPLAGGAAGPLI